MCNRSMTWLSLKIASQRGRSSPNCIDKLWNKFRKMFISIKWWRLWISHHVQNLISLKDSMNPEKSRLKICYWMPVIFEPSVLSNLKKLICSLKCWVFLRNGEYLLCCSLIETCVETNTSPIYKLQKKAIRIINGLSLLFTNYTLLIIY